MVPCLWRSWLFFLRFFLPIGFCYVSFGLLKFRKVCGSVEGLLGSFGTRSFLSFLIFLLFFCQLVERSFFSSLMGMILVVLCEVGFRSFFISSFVTLWSSVEPSTSVHFGMEQMADSWILRKRTDVSEQPYNLRSLKY